MVEEFVLQDFGGVSSAPRSPPTRCRFFISSGEKGLNAWITLLTSGCVKRRFEVQTPPGVLGGKKNDFAFFSGVRGASF